MDSYSFRCGGRVVVTGKVVVSKEFLSEENLGTIGPRQGTQINSIGSTSLVLCTGTPWYHGRLHGVDERRGVARRRGIVRFFFDVP